MAAWKVTVTRRLHRAGRDTPRGGIDAAGHVHADDRRRRPRSIASIASATAPRGVAREARAEQRIDDHRGAANGPRPIGRPAARPALPRRRLARQPLEVGARVARSSCGGPAHTTSPRVRRRAAAAPRPARRRRCCPCRTPPRPARPARALDRARDAAPGALHQLEPATPRSLDRPAIDRAHRLGVGQRRQPVGKRSRSDARWSAIARDAPARYSTVTVFARLRGWSTFSPRRRAIS